MLTKEEFDEIKAGSMFDFGQLSNSPEGIFMTRGGGELKWVAVKGRANDWAIYCHWPDHTEEWIKAHGDKVLNEVHIRRCVPCEDSVFNRYRY